MNNYLTKIKKMQTPAVNDLMNLSFIDDKQKKLAQSNFAYVVANNYNIETCDPISVASAIVQMTNLNFSASTGEMYVIPYGNKATAQVGYKGLISLALRSKEIEKINAGAVYEGEFKGLNRLTGDYEFEFKDTPNGEPIGYFAYLKLNSGFSKTIYMSAEEMHDHFVKFSKNNYDEITRTWMESKKFKTVSKILDVFTKSKITMLKKIISQWAPKNPLLDAAIQIDGAVFNENGVMEKEESIKTIEPADTNFIRTVLNVVGNRVKDELKLKNKKEITQKLNEYGRQAGINFQETGGWYGVSRDHLIALCFVVEQDLKIELLIEDKRLSQEKPTDEQEKVISLNSV